MLAHKYRVALSLYLLLQCSIGNALVQQVINVTVQGVICPFCIHVLKKNLSQLANIDDVKMTSDDNALIVTIKPGAKPDTALINKTILASGYLTLKTSISSINTSSQSKKQTIDHIAIKNQPCSRCHNR